MAGSKSISQEIKVLNMLAECLLKPANLILKTDGQMNATQVNEFGEMIGKLYVAIGIAMDMGLIPQGAMYAGRVAAGETMAEFFDRFPLERNHPDIKRLFTDVRRPVE